MVAPAPKATSWLVQHVRNLLQICAMLFLMLIGTTQNNYVFVNKDIQLLDINVFVMELHLKDSVIDVHIDPTPNTTLESVDAMMDILWLDLNACPMLTMAIIRKVIVQWVASLIHNKRNVWLVPVDVLNVLIATLAKLALLTSSLTSKVNFVLKNVVMARSMLKSVMMVIIMMVMDVLLLAKSKQDILAEEDHLPHLILACYITLIELALVC